MKEAPSSELTRTLRRGTAAEARAAFDALYALHASRLMRFVQHLTAHPAHAEDLFQEAWLRLAKSPPELGSDLDVLPWLLRVARNAWISRLRKERHGGPVPDLEPHIDVAHDPEQQLVSVQAHEGLSRALASLCEADREVLLLIGVEGLSHPQVAEILGVSGVALRQRLSRARARLQSLLDAESTGAKLTPLHAVKGGAR